MWLPKMPWMRDRKEIHSAKEDVRKTRGELATKLVELERNRHLLDDMVRRSLELMESKK